MTRARIDWPTFTGTDHLGGYDTGDPLSWCPDLWDWLIDTHGVHSVIDVGCGSGETVDYLVGQGCDAIGVEGVPQPNLRIIQHDYTTGPAPLEGRVDLVWSCEFVEHVEERYVPNFLATFALGDLVLMTHAVPGQPGYHHVNCRDSSYWVAALERVGHVYDAELTDEARALAGGYFARTGLAFRRRATP